MDKFEQVFMSAEITIKNQLKICIRTPGVFCSNPISDILKNVIINFNSKSPEHIIFKISKEKDKIFATTDFSGHICKPCLIDGFEALKIIAPDQSDFGKQVGFLSRMGCSVYIVDSKFLDQHEAAAAFSFSKKAIFLRKSDVLNQNDIGEMLMHESTHAEHAHSLVNGGIKGYAECSYITTTKAGSVYPRCSTGELAAFIDGMCAGKGITLGDLYLSILTDRFKKVSQALELVAPLQLVRGYLFNAIVNNKDPYYPCVSSITFDLPKMPGYSCTLLLDPKQMELNPVAEISKRLAIYKKHIKDQCEVAERLLSINLQTKNIKICA